MSLPASASASVSVDALQSKGHARTDLVIGLLLLIVAAGFCWYRTAVLGSELNHPSMFGSYFSADTPRVFSNLTLDGKSHRAHVHPLFTVLAAPPVKAIELLTGSTPETAAFCFYSIVCGLWSLILWILLRRLDLSRPEAAGFSILGIVCSSSIFWFPIAETHPLASLSVLLGLLPLVSAAGIQQNKYVHLAVGLVTFGVTVTNWLVGVTVSWFSIARKQAAQVFLMTLLVSATVWAGQKVLIWDHEVPGRYTRELKFLQPLDASRVVDVNRIFFLNSVVMSAPTGLDEPQARPPRQPFVHLQGSSLGRGGVPEWVALASWAALLGLGGYGMLRHSGFPKVRKVIAIFLGFHWALYTLYGEETFLFIVNCVPCLLLVAGFATKTRFRNAVLPLLAVLIVSAAYTNWRYFRQTADFLRKADPTVLPIPS